MGNLRTKNLILKGIHSFTLVELLIVIAILAILAAAVVIVINPGEMLAQARDAERISSIESLKKSIDLFILDNPSAPLGTSQTVYISLPDASSSTCGSITSLPSLPSPWVYHCVTAANLRKTDSTGWIPLNLGNIYGGSPISSLPIDPVNDSASGKYYTYVMGGSYELTALMEAEKHDVAVKDGGTFPGVFQAGTHIDLTPALRDSGMVGYWTFDGTGSVVNGQTTGINDSSGKGNIAVASNANGTGMAFVAGKIGNALQFDGVDDGLRVSSVNYSISKAFTASGWFNFNKYSHMQLLDNRAFSLKWRISGETPYWNVYDASNGYIGSFHYSSAPNLNEWHHYAITYNGSSIKTYIDGVNIIQNSANANTTNRVDLIISPASGELMSGLMDDLRVYNRALSDSEIKVIYDATK